MRKPVVVMAVPAIIAHLSTFMSLSKALRSVVVAGYGEHAWLRPMVIIMNTNATLLAMP